MSLRLLTALFALAALVLSAVPARAQQDTPTGTIAIRGSLLAAHDQDPAAAPAADGFGSVSILTPDGRTLTLADASLHGADYVWDDDQLVFGSYYIDTAGIVAPEGYSFLRMAGGMEDNGGYLVDLTADAPHAYVFAAFLAQDAGEEPVQLDGDGDGLMDEEELQIGTDPSTYDTDVDRLSDGFEVRELGTDPLRADTDEDGLGDGDELETFQTDPLDADTDEDGYDDATELDAGTDPNDPDSVPGGGVTLDADGDGLMDEQELQIGTDPNDPDSDDDGYNDLAEVEAGSDPLDGNSIPGGKAESTMVVNVLILPAEYDGNDYIGDSEPLEDVNVTVSIPYSEWGVTRTADEDGRVAVEGLGEGVYNVTLHIPGNAADFITVFGVEDGFEPRQHENQNTNNPAVYVGPDETLFGTFYVIPADAGAEPEPRPTKPAQPIKALPNTGAGAEAEETSNSETLALILAGGLAVVGVVALGRKRLA